MTDFPRRGQIHWVDFSPTKGSEQSGRRPALIVSNDTANQHSPVVVVVPLTSSQTAARFPQNVSLPAGRPLPDAGVILCGQIRTVSKERLDGYRGDLEAAQQEAVDKALGTALDLPI